MSKFSVTIHSALGSMAEAMDADLGWVVDTKPEADDLCNAVNMMLGTLNIDHGGERFAMVTELGVPSSQQVGIGQMDAAGNPVGAMTGVALSVLHDLRECYEGDLADQENTALDNLPALPVPLPPGTTTPTTLEEAERFLDG